MTLLPQTPSWHSDTNVVQPGTSTFSSVREQLGIDWDLYRRPRRTPGANRWSDIVRSDTNEVVNPRAAKSFRLITIDDFGHYVEAALHHQNVIWDTFHIFSGGAAMAATVRLDEPIEIKGDDSPVYPYMAFTNRVDGKGALKAFLAMARMSCANMVNSMVVTAQKHGGIIQFTHGQKFNMSQAIDLTRMMITRERDLANAFAVRASQLNEKEIDVQQFMDRWLPLSTDMTERQERNIEAKRGMFQSTLRGSYSVGRENTAWSVLQAAVESYQYKFHVKGEQARERRTVGMMSPSMLQQSELKKAYWLVLRQAGMDQEMAGAR